MSHIFTPTDNGNEILSTGEDWYVSFRQGDKRNPLLNLFSAFGKAILNITEEPDETAIRVGKGKDCRWYILNGDYRIEMELAARDGLDGVMKVYRDNIAHRSDWSSEGE